MLLAVACELGRDAAQPMQCVLATFTLSAGSRLARQLCLLGPSLLQGLHLQGVNHT